MSSPVTFEVERPPVFQRAHVFLRVALLIVVGWIGHPFGLLWLGLPVVAAILVSQKGGQRYLDENGPTVTRVVHGFGNDGSGVEGAVAGRVVGTYLHGPALARNAALADLLLSWVVGPLPPVDDHEVAALRQERLAAAGRDSRRRRLLAWRR